jgi:S-DNA-T family DNA segregation ATPase FtsK/SpoIIIE
MRIVYQTPSGNAYTIYRNMLKQTHLLIAGATGSGKSVVINGIVSTALFNSPAKAEFILIDPKRVELAQYKNLPHTLLYASEPVDILKALDRAMILTESRYREMQRKGLKRYDGSDVYIIIDELADIMTAYGRKAAPIIQRLAQIGRAANIHIIAATQCPLSSVIPTPIKVNFDARVGLRTRSAQDSRNILGFNGCEELPRYGYGIYITPEETLRTEIPMVADEESERLLNYWKTYKPKRFFR